MSMDADDQDRIAALERVVAAQSYLIEELADFAESAMRRMLALEKALVDGGIVTRAVIDARAQELDLDATAEIELAPQHGEFRRARAVLRRLQEDHPSEE